MGYKSLEDCLSDLEKHHHLVRVKEEVDPQLEMAAIHLKVHAAGGPAILFENIRGSKYKAVSNLFGTLERSEFIFRHSLEKVRQLINLKIDPLQLFKKPAQNISAALSVLKAFPLQNPSDRPVLFEEIKITDLPLIKHWPLDGGAFVTMPQVYTEDPDKPGVMNANLGMYRIQLNGNDYLQNKEIGLHYQLHRGIGVHQTKANSKGMPLKVSIFVGGPPSHSVAAVMPLPEGMSELSFAAVLGGRRFRYIYKDGYCISTDADFVITGEVYPGENKEEGPFGDHLGYYSLKHPFPLMRVHKVWAKKNAIWPFTVVGRPPQEDTSFGKLIHSITGNALKNEIPGLKEVHAVDAAGVHPLLLAIGSERYTPYNPTKQPAELLTIANHVLGTGQLSLAKFLFITAEESNNLSTRDIPAFLKYIIERIQLHRDLHFYTNTTIDTLDYSGTGLNSGSKLVFAAYGDPVRTAGTKLPDFLSAHESEFHANLVMPGILSIAGPRFTDYDTAKQELSMIEDKLKDYSEELEPFPFIILADDPEFVAASLNNFLWVSFTRTNPSHDIYGIHSFQEFKHWGCRGSLIIDARIKPHHAPVLETDPETIHKISPVFEKGGSLFGYG